MDRSVRILLLVFFIALSAFRLLRYVKAGTAKRPQSAVPGSAGLILPATQTPPSVVSPIEPAGTASGRLLSALATAVVWVAGNVVIWWTLFGMPAFNDVPPIWRLVGGVFCNFFLIHLARAAGATLRKRLQQSPPASGDSPFL